MIGIGFKVEIKKSKVITDSARVLALPLTEVHQMLAVRILDRVARGMGPKGPWSTYANHSGGELPPGEFFWVPPGRPQPGQDSESPQTDGLVFRVKKGEWAGWAAYRSVTAYYKLRGLVGVPHDYGESGDLLTRAVVRIISARHTRLAFYGRHKNGLTAKQVAWWASRNESEPLLMPSQSEVQEAQAFLTGKINERIVNAGRLSEGAQKITSTARSVTRRTSKLLGD